MPQLREVKDVTDHGPHLRCRDTHRSGAQIDVLVQGAFGIKPETEVEERLPGSAHLQTPTGRAESSSQHTEQGGFTSTIATNQRDAIPLFNIEGYFVQQGGKPAAGNGGRCADEGSKPRIPLPLRLGVIRDVQSDVVRADVGLAHDLLPPVRSTAARNVHNDDTTMPPEPIREQL